jgi:hypothetical protein
MSKMSDFYVKVSSDAELLAKVNEALGDTEVTQASDAQLTKIGEIAKGAGFEITLAEAKEYLAAGEFDLGDDALANVAGGEKDGKHTTVVNKCSGKDAGVKV